MSHRPWFRITGLCWLAAVTATAFGALPPVPVPAENPFSEEKRALGKILFWDEQLSSDNSVACGSCHHPAAGGTDPREARHPGTNPGTIDDVLGSPGIVKLDARGLPIEDPVFGFDVQVTERASQSNFAALWAEELFWDGRAGSRFVDPLTGEVVIPSGGALETQALMALMSPAEMSKAGRRWAEITAKLARVAPLALADDWPADVAALVRHRRSYPALFAAAFGDSAITPVRIAFALASYQRSLVADQTPWDRYEAGELEALSATELYGLKAMQDFQCLKCHTPPLFTNNDFTNVGLRRSEFDRGRQNVTGDVEDAGEVKVPSLRNVGLHKRFMHTGQFTNLAAAIGFYRTGPVLPERDDIPGGGIYAFNMGVLTDADIGAFLRTALTDPRVRDELFPFDRPRLRSERHIDDHRAPETPQAFAASFDGELIRLTWRAAKDDTGVVDYRLLRDDTIIALTTETHYSERYDPETPPLRYSLSARDAQRNESAHTEILVTAEP